jgi:hypothetical protein
LIRHEEDRYEVILAMDPHEEDRYEIKNQEETKKKGEK